MKAPANCRLIGLEKVPRIFALRARSVSAVTDDNRIARYRQLGVDFRLRRRKGYPLRRASTP